LVEASDLLDARDFDGAAIHPLLQATRDFADQARTALSVMRDRGADEAALQDVKDLLSFFWTTEERIEAMLGLCRGRR
jgi:hypothetical protein